MASTSLTQWLRALSRRDALLRSWISGSPPRTSLCETEALALVALASKQQKNITLGHPGGSATLPLLTAVHAAALQLDGYPSPFQPVRNGPVVYLTRQAIRLKQIVNLDAAEAPVSPALKAVRLRADGLVVPMSGGRARAFELRNKLVISKELPAAAGMSLAAVIIDGADEDDAFVENAVAWGKDSGAPVILFEDSARRRWPARTMTYSCGWAEFARHAEAESDLYRIATRRGHAAVLDVGDQPGLAKSALLLADARGRGRSLPPVLIEAATIWRRLDELVTPLRDYDAACPRWRTPTLSERIEDLMQRRASDFPPGWRSWAETCWAGIKEGIVGTCENFSDSSPKASLLAELVHTELSAGRKIDIALPSRTARDATLRYLAKVGVLIPVDGSLEIRRLVDSDACWRSTPTLLASPPGYALRHRLTGCDIGPINVLCYKHEIHALRRALDRNLDELLRPYGAIEDLAPKGLSLEIDRPDSVPQIVLESVPIRNNPKGSRRLLLDFASSADAKIIDALQISQELPDLPDDDGSVEQPGTAFRDRLTAFVPLEVVSDRDGEARVFNVPVHHRILRIAAGSASRISVLDVQPGMLVADLVEPTTFDRLRTLLMESRGAVPRMFLAAWEQALTNALDRCGSSNALAEELSRQGSTIGRAAVGEWTDVDRIGPQDSADVGRVGRIAGHPIVDQNAAAIAETMHQLRLLHQRVGRTVIASIGGDEEDLDDIESLLGPDAVAIVNETVVYRVAGVGKIVGRDVS
ncbi:DISARM anti-phage system protein DrmE domain-containing protein [Mycobacterium szulgai]|uniref:DISARM anti-phage system protein DrmE domain-containing protein n=1 Tax=Mycobacterium szulgai TaxID=1787 RepID=UPI00146FA39A|nr:hypothetical protein [Mycobacterium szulgai]MCV7078731.1 hypothetical protein [Mycobacterium szulgai]